MKDIYYMGTNCVEHYRLEQVQDLDAKFRMYEVLLQYGTDNKISDTNILLDVDLQNKLIKTKYQIYNRQQLIQYTQPFTINNYNINVKDQSKYE